MSVNHGIFGWLRGLFEGRSGSSDADKSDVFDDDDDDQTAHGINPGSGLPMLDGGIDIAGNPYGCGDDDFGGGYGDINFDD